MVVNLSESHSLLSNWMLELRSSTIQQDRFRFRRNLERIGEVAAYEISKLMPFKVVVVETPLGTHNSKVLLEQPVLATILRAGLPLHNGLLNFFDNADNAFIAAYRKHNRDGSFEICLEYLSCPSLNDRILILSDPMLATGASLAKTVQYLKAVGLPKEIYIVCAIASTVGLDYIERECGSNVKIFCGDIDDEITAKGYIVPGLGDAGDLAYGIKVQY
jgi:uracil phosphoribosyltransferase